jgi:hypothetical protein
MTARKDKRVRTRKYTVTAPVLLKRADQALLRDLKRLVPAQLHDLLTARIQVFAQDRRNALAYTVPAPQAKARVSRADLILSALAATPLTLSALQEELGANSGQQRAALIKALRGLVATREVRGPTAQRPWYELCK